MVLGAGRYDYLITILHVRETSERVLMLVEVKADSMTEAIQAVEALTTGEVITCVKMWVDL